MWECKFFIYKIQLLAQQIQNVIKATVSNSKFKKEKKLTIKNFKILKSLIII